MPMIHLRLTNDTIHCKLQHNPAIRNNNLYTLARVTILAYPLILVRNMFKRNLYRFTSMDNNGYIHRYTNLC